MPVKHLETHELCFYKLLLLKSDVFENKLLDFRYLEEETKINKHHLLASFKNLLENNLVSFSSEVFTDAYIKAYRDKRAEFEKGERNISIAAVVGGGHYYDYEKTELWKTLFTDKYCGLTKEIFDKLAKEKSLKVKINKKILNTGNGVLQLVYYFKFKISVDKIKLAEYLGEYLRGFIKNQYNDGTKYAYTKQVKEISDAIKKLISAGFSAESLLIDNAQIFPKNKMDIRPTDGERQEAILLYDFLDTVLSMEKEGLLKVLDIKYQKEANRGIVYSDLLWEDPIKIKISICDKLYQAERDEIKKTEMMREAIDKRVRQITEENNRWVEEIAQPPQNTNFTYNPNTGDGQFGGKEFRLKDGTDYRKLFDACYTIKGEKLEKKKVIEILGLKTNENAPAASKLLSTLGGDDERRRKTNTEVSITGAINEVVKKIRDKTELDTKQLVNNGGNITLVI